MYVLNLAFWAEEIGFSIAGQNTSVSTTAPFLLTTYRIHP